MNRVSSGVKSKYMLPVFGRLVVCMYRTSPPNLNVCLPFTQLTLSPRMNTFDR